jgi:multiple sugar transport system ATP-binding protein
MAGIVLRGVHKSFGEVEVIRGVDLEIEDREFVVFVGPSGCGKSTMLRLIGGLEEVTEGQIIIGDQDVTGLPPAERSLSMVFQSYALYPHKTVRDNMGFPLKMAGEPKEQVAAAVKEAANVLKLEPLLDRLPKELSGGQRQRVAIVRAPLAFLFDEPLSNLDAALRVQMRVEIARLHRRLRSTMVYVTHDQVEAMTLAHRIVVFSEGQIEQIGPPLELYENPANLFVATFIGSPGMNILSGKGFGEGQFRLEDGSGLKTDRTLAEVAENADQMGIRPEHIELDSEGPVRGKIAVVERLGADSFLHVDLEAGTTILVRQNGNSSLEEETNVRMRFLPEHLHLFNVEGKAVTKNT